MKSFALVHRLALAALFVNAAMSIIGSLSAPWLSLPMHVVSVVFAAGFWTLLIVKIWKRPRKWGLGVGIFLLLMVAFQTYLWLKAMEHPRPELLGLSATLPGFLLYEIPLLLGAVCCLILPFQSAPGRR